MRGLLVAIAIMLVADTLSAQDDVTAVVGDQTIEYRYTPIDQTSHTQTGIERFGLRLNDYLTMAADDKRGVKFSVVGAPAYSENTGWRLSAVATMHYRTQNVDLPHTLSLRGMASLRGCYSLALDGVNYLGSTRHELRYGGGFGRESAFLYGLDYDASLQGMRGGYVMRDYNAYLHYFYRVNSVLTLGLRADYNGELLLNCDDRVDAILSGAETMFSGVGLGLNMTYSTRRTEDINVVRGVYLRVEYIVHPAALTRCGDTLHEVNLTFDYYQPLWRGGLLALDIYGEHHSANTPWMMRANLGGDSRMRGYYYGRFNGNSMAVAQVELRQRVWEGLVLAGWGGCGMTFSVDDPAAWRKVLPTYGAGVRWYLNANSVVRIDYALGRNCSAFVVGYSESF